ncbi:hypothetical protein TIFTF001_039691 [Ficus carica]|uniref:Uncharacterized protein n=1 Tax=Ficus carica TaxID=3494 RepID=A0AA88EJV7_FICCA|nr:hypothetical protein TIFTF001_039691 [Ficus carica]
MGATIVGFNGGGIGDDGTAMVDYDGGVLRQWEGLSLGGVVAGLSARGKGSTSRGPKLLGFGLRGVVVEVWAWWDKTQPGRVDLEVGVPSLGGRGLGCANLELAVLSSGSGHSGWKGRLGSTLGEWGALGDSTAAEGGLGCADLALGVPSPRFGQGSDGG